MSNNPISYRAVFSSDWSECLSPNGPFDPIAFNYRELTPKLKTIFGDYTGNRITLRHAMHLISELLAEPFSQERMDAYLDAEFKTYVGVPELIEWCLARNILFMINTTGTQAYFQRAIAKGLLPRVPIVSANPLIRFADPEYETRFRHQVLEIDDKPKNTEAVMRSLGLPPSKVVVMGDSGGDGPHFQWGAAAGAFLIGSMTKPSLAEYCGNRSIAINSRFGMVYAPGESRNLDEEMKIDFMALTDIITAAIESAG